MKVLVVGGGGREHAIVKKISENPKVDEIYALPGNGGIEKFANCVPIAATDIEKIVDFAVSCKVDFAVVTPDDPLIMGCADLLRDKGIAVFGPSKKAARIEGSKSYSKAFMKKYGIPTANYEEFTSYEEALDYVKSQNSYPTVIKADGPALGKGVIIAKDEDEADAALRSMMKDKAFGASGEKVVIEEFLEGPEITVLAFCDGENIRPMLSSMDHKKVGDGDVGLNTGGMGVVAPNPFYTREVETEVYERIMLPTIKGLIKEEAPFKGCIYFGLMLTKQGVKVIEYNCRFGDPEAQTVLPMLRSDLLDIMIATEEGRIDEMPVEFTGGASCCVVIASGGYPKKYAKGYDIDFSELFGNSPKAQEEAGFETDGGVIVFHAGTTVTHENGDSVYRTNGGRVLNVVVTADTLEDAIEKAYKAARKIKFKDMFFRNDIGAKALEEERRRK